MEFTFAHNNFNVLDLEKSLKFYEEALGLKEDHRKVAEDGSFILVYLTDGKTPHLLERIPFGMELAAVSASRAERYPCPTIGHGTCKLRFPQLSRFCPVLPHERKSFRSPYPPSHPCILQGFFAVTASLFPARAALSAHSQQRRPCMKVKGKIVYWTDH